jgi:hypothetical protein
VLEDIATHVIACGGPVDSGTKPQPVKWHDDKVSGWGEREGGGQINRGGWVSALGMRGSWVGGWVGGWGEGGHRQSNKAGWVSESRMEGS